MKRETNVIAKTAVQLFLVSCMLTACGQQATAPNDSGRIVVENDTRILHDRIDYFDRDVVVERPTQQSSNPALRKFGPIRLKLRAEISPPSIEGQTLHASHVTFDAQNAYVSYSTVQSEYRGAVDIVDITDVLRPVIRSQALFMDTDITIAMAFHGRLFLGEATNSDNDSAFDTPACLEVLELQDGRLTTQSQRVDLPSFNANDLECFDDAVFITSGSSHGALTVLRDRDFSLIRRILVDGAKALGHNDSHIFVMEGTGSYLYSIDRASLATASAISLGCDNLFQEKAEMHVDGDRVYLSANRCGVLVVNMETETVETAVPAPSGGQTNGVSVSDSLIFMANGSHGLQIVRITADGFVAVGQTSFEGSTNFVAANGRVLFVANGVGGLKILEILDAAAPIEVVAQSHVRADKAEADMVDAAAATVAIDAPGKYRLSALVDYSGEDQRNESFYLNLRDGAGSTAQQLNANAGAEKVVADGPYLQGSAWRDCGVFELSTGSYVIDVCHYAKIAALYPQFLHGPIAGPESVHISAFRMELIER